jgi:hypothetical protein
MEFKQMFVRPSGGENGGDVPEILQEYCDAMQRAQPRVAVYFGDDELDLGTLHSSASFKDGLVRLSDDSNRFSSLTVAWSSGYQHEVTQDGVWRDVDGTALKYEVTYTEDGTPTTLYMGILFPMEA